MVCGRLEVSKIVCASKTRHPCARVSQWEGWGRKCNTYDSCVITTMILALGTTIDIQTMHHSLRHTCCWFLTPISNSIAKPCIIICIILFVGTNVDTQHLHHHLYHTFCWYERSAWYTTHNMAHSIEVMQLRYG